MGDLRRTADRVAARWLRWCVIVASLLAVSSLAVIVVDILSDPPISSGEVDVARDEVSVATPPTMELDRSAPLAQPVPLAAPHVVESFVVATDASREDSLAPVAARRLVVTAVDTGGRPMPDVQVVVSDGERIVARGVTRLSSGGGEAGCVLQCPPGPVRISAEGGGGRLLAALPPDVPLDPTGHSQHVPADLDEVVLLMSQDFSLTLRVTSARDGSPVSQAAVDLAAEGDLVPFVADEPEIGEMHLELPTDASGVLRFTMPGRSWRRLAVGVKAAGFAELETSFALATGDAVGVFDVQLEPLPDTLRVRGVVVRDDGSALPGVRLAAGPFVSLREDAHGWGFERAWLGESDDAGRFSFHWTPRTPRERLVVMPQRPSWSRIGVLGPLTIAEVTSGELQLVLAPAATREVPIRVEGVVREGRYVAQIGLSLEDTSLTSLGSALPRGAENADGVLEATLELPDDRTTTISVWTFFDSLPRVDTSVPIVFVPSSPPPLPLVFVVDRLSAVSGVLELPADLPTDADVSLAVERGSRRLAVREISRDGIFRIAGLPAGAFELHAWHSRPGEPRLELGRWSVILADRDLDDLRLGAWNRLDDG